MDESLAYERWLAVVHVLIVVLYLYIQYNKVCRSYHFIYELVNA